uniref:hypothetical protein n=1 Tax=Hanstruepera ponticola TaxID=2042995 RepID=UPI00177AECE0
MKQNITFRIPKTTMLLLFLFLFSFQFHAQQSISSLNRDCGTIESVQFTNGSQSISIEDGNVYDLSELPANFYLKLDVQGNSESARISAENLETNERIAIIDNSEEYTFPNGDTSWSLGTGTFKVMTAIHAGDRGRGRNCDRAMFTITITNNCFADAGTLTADMDSVELVNGMATLSATPDGNSNVPAGYNTVYVLTQGSGLVIVNAG